MKQKTQLRLGFKIVLKINLKRLKDNSDGFHNLI